MNVIPFKGPGVWPRPAHPVQPPAALAANVAAETARSRAADEAEDRLRMQQNVAVLAAVAVLMLLGAWIIDGLQRYTHTLACLETGHRQCAVLDVSNLPHR